MLTRPAQPAAGRTFAAVAALWACGVVALVAPAAGPPTVGPPAPDSAATPTTAPPTRPAAAAPAPTTPEIEKLVGLLGSRNWKAREKAQDRLVDLGSAAEPRLRELLDAAVDSQTRMGIQQALTQMAADRKLGPTLVTVRAKGAAPKDVFDDLSRQIHLPIGPQNEALWRQREWPAVTLELVDRPFWDALRQACAAAGVRPLFAGGDDEPRRIVLAVDVTGEMKSPSCVSGAFMVMATGVTRRPTFDAPPPAAGAAATTDANLTLTFFADPRWRILNHPDDARVEQVSDAAGGPLPRPEPMKLPIYKASSSTWSMSTVLTKLPAGADGDALKRLRGSFKITLLDQSDPIVVDDVLAARGVVRRAGRQSILVQEVIRNGDQYRVKLVVGRNGLTPQPWRQEREAEGVVLMDAKGRPWARGGNSAEIQDDGEQAAYDLSFVAGGDPDPPGTPARLVCQVPLEPRELVVPFELADVAVEK